jgi:hypothetical protein
MMTTVEIGDGYYITLDANKARGLKAELAKLVPGRAYTYEEASGKKVVVTYVGPDCLNLKFKLSNGSDYFAPVMDMGDGSLVTEYLTPVKETASVPMSTFERPTGQDPREENPKFQKDYEEKRRKLFEKE